MTTTRVAIVLRLILAAVFLYAGITKALDVNAFSQAIGRYDLMPAMVNFIVAAVLPYLEIYTALLLLSGLWLRAATWLSILMCSTFCLALLSAAVRGLSIDCGCFGSSAGAWSSVGVALMRAIALLAFSLYLLLASTDNVVDKPEVQA
ncbi:MAG: hypothetical protein BA874_03100 [Desulfuromonadales bacterium C00003068]|jgi:uncharacterized membrane protein YphA (DoxX/SURF4 family)|nr:MAG: hypothetical protein BA874_03100 [Desulfuromonadales bacterium C00003068]